MLQGDEIVDYPIQRTGALDVPEEWDRFRQKCPVAHVRLPSGDPAVLLTRYDDVRQVLSDPRFGRRTAVEGAARIGDGDSSDVFSSEMSMVVPQTGDGHQRWRRMLTKFFTAKKMNILRPAIEAMAEQLVDEMIKQDHPADLKASLGFPLPVWVICDLLGVPDSDRDRFAYWSDTLLNLTRYEKAEIDAAQAEFGTYMAGHIAAKRAMPGEDLLSELITATDSAGEQLPDSMLIATGMGLLVAGHETTANMIGKMMAMLLADRSRWEQLLADPTLVPTAVEEALRYDVNAGFGMVRFLSEEVEVAGHVLPAGTTAVCSMASANRDPEVFDVAGDMDLNRSPNLHLSFGAGPNSCIGQPLARAELQIVLEVLLRRLPNLELAVTVDELRPVEGLAVGGLREVPVRW